MTGHPAGGSGFGGQIIAALEAAWSAVRERHPEVPAAVVITGTGGRKGYQLHGHHWPARWVTGPAAGQRAPELFIAGELLSSGGRAVLEVMLHESAHALAAARHIKDTSADGNRYHNRRFAALAAEVGLQPPGSPAKVTGWSDCAISAQTASAYATVIASIDQARLPFLPTPTAPGSSEGGVASSGGQRRAGRRVAAECGCSPPRRVQLTPKALETGPLICGLCKHPFQTSGGAPAEPGSEDGHGP
jgi:hypothetical protein